MDAEEFRRRGKELVDYIADYLEGGVEDYDPHPRVEPGYMRRLLPQAPPVLPEPYSDVMQDFQDVILPGVTHWQSRKFHAYYPSSTSYPSMLADMLANTIMSMGFNWMSSPANTELEIITTDWLAQMLKLPSCFLHGGQGGGVIQSSASEGSLISVLAARTRTIAELRRNKPNLTETEIMGRLVAYCSDQSHSSGMRAFSLGAVEYRTIKSDENNAMRGEALQTAITEDKLKGLIPFFVLVTLGTTASCSFDQLLEIGPICKSIGVWLHIDAAYAGSAFICPEFRPLLDGVEFADSFNFNPQKWLLVNVECSVIWFKNSTWVINSGGTQMSVKETEQSSGNRTNFKDWQVAMGGKFRSLKLWFVIRMYGVSGLQAHIRKFIALAHQFETLVLSDTRFEVIQKVILGLVCFRLKGKSNADNERLTTLINEDGRIHLVGAQSKDVYFTRFVVCSPRSEPSDIEFSWSVISQVTSKFLNTYEVADSTSCKSDESTRLYS